MPTVASLRILAATVTFSAAALIQAPPAVAQTANVRAAPLNYTVLASRFGMPGISEADAQMMQAMMPAGSEMPGGYSIGKHVELRINHRQASIPMASHAAPANANMTLLPWSGGKPGTDGEPDFPQYKISFYWGCGTAVRSGQPRVFDSSRMSAAEAAKAIPYARGGQVRRCSAGQTCWPNTQTTRERPPASILGDHAVTAANQPTIKFNLGRDYLGAMELSSQGSITSGMNVSWPAVNDAQAYYLMAVHANDNNKEMTIWTSSEIADAGSANMAFISQATLQQWLRDKLLLAPSQTQCQIPAGIFTQKDTPVLATAFGGEQSFVHPPRPADARAPWNQEWAATVRFSSFAMTSEEMSGAGNSGGSRPSRSGRASESGAPSQAGQGSTSGTSSTTDAVRQGAEGVLRGIFGR